MSLVYFEQNARHCLVSAHSLCVQHWSAPPTLEDLARVDAQLEQGVRRYGRISQLGVLAWKGGRMARGEREQVAALHRKYEAQSLGSCAVIETLGLSGLMLRTLVAGVQLLSLGHGPAKVLPRVPVALQWLGARPGQHPETVREFAALERQLRWPLVRLADVDQPDQPGAP